MSDDVLISANDVSKKFCRSLRKSLWYGLQDMCQEVAGTTAADKPLRAEEFWAVRGVSFEVRRGECVGLIGRNGAGKTTLLRMLNGLIKPDTGSLRLRGAIGALIALGAGFNPILTGRENIYAAAAVLGFSKRAIDRQIDSIIDFAEIGPAVDSPVQSYSSGMQVRLGFAVATALEPDVLLLDEVLAVGDERFQLKCYERVGSLLQRGVATILVSHQLLNIERLCTRCIVMAAGGVKVDTTDIRTATQAYHSLNAADDPAVQAFVAPSSPVTIEDVAFDADGSMVVLRLHRKQPSPQSVLVSFTLEFNGTQLLRGTSKQLDDPLIPIVDDRVTLAIPRELRRLGPLTLSVSLWTTPSSPQPLAWARNIAISAITREPYLLWREPPKTRLEASRLSGHTA